MKGKTHAGVGITVFLSMYNKIPGGFTFLGLLIVVIASLLPDIDHPKSIANKYILVFKNKMAKLVFYSSIGILIIWYDYLCCHEPAIRAIGIIFIIIAVSSHRNGFTHSLTGLITFSFVTGYLGNRYAIDYIIYYFMIGYSAHLVCDMVTSRGIPLLYPFDNKKYKFPLTYKSNSKTGNIIETLIAGISLFFIIYKLPTIFQK